MPEILRSLIVVLCVAIAALYFAKPHFVSMGIKPENYDVQRTLWFGIILSAFLANDYFVFAGLFIVLTLAYVRRHSNPLALYVGILFAVPLFGKDIPGFGIINYFFTLDYSRLLSLFILFPVYLTLRQQKETERFGSTWSDKIIFLYLMYGLVRQYPLDTFTNLLRTTFYQILDVYLPYYVASRYIKSLEDLREVLASFVLGALLIGLFGVIEYGKGWLLFSRLEDALDANEWGYGRYLIRGDSLRAVASTGQAIVLGYIMAVAFGLYLYLKEKLSSRKLQLLLGLLLLAGLFAPLSRGPWLGAAGILMLFIALSPQPVKRLVQAAFFTIIVGGMALASPYGESLIDKLPFIGKVDEQNVVHRERLLDNALEVIARNPYFGAYDFILAPEMQELRNGGDQGIVDIVNSYLAVALSGGLVGLALFVGPFLAILTSLGILVFRARGLGADHAVMGRALFVTLIGIMLMIYTVSSIIFIPLVYWVIAGLSLAYVRVVRKNAVPTP